ncbi:O-antigen polysaccharide polymerase Wzy [Cohnella sp. GCM10020058]|uniref:O-antigen polysaccharide polymerase Wzy n=1 Tax=Cohnella sp. GCM10020058 TaxID=3317330 RepID=UPI003639CB31
MKIILNNKYKNMLHYSFICLILFGLGILAENSYSGIETKLFVLCWLGNFIFITSIIIWKRMTGKLFSPYIFFLISFYFFSFGQGILNSFGIKYRPWDLYSLFDSLVLLKAHYYTIVGITFLHFGAMFAYEKKVLYTEDKSDISSIVEASRIVAVILMLASSYFFFSSLLNNLKASMLNGYMSLYDYSRNQYTSTSLTTNLILTLKLFFVPSIFLILLLYKNSLIRLLTLITLMFSIVASFAAGLRTDAAALFISALILWLSNKEKLKIKQLIVIGISGLSLFSIFTAVGVLRGESSRDGKTIFLVFLHELITNNPVVNTIGEMGGSMFPLIKVTELLPQSFAYKYGESYISALLAVFPNFMIQPFISRVSLPNWLMETLNMDYGPGFSLLAEGYYNFGVFGACFMALIGFVFLKCLNLDAHWKRFNIIKPAFISVMVYFLIASARGDMLLLFREFIFYVIGPLILIFIIQNIQDSLRKRKYR